MNIEGLFLGYLKGDLLGFVFSNRMSEALFLVYSTGDLLGFVFNNRMSKILFLGYLTGDLLVVSIFLLKWINV